MENLLLEYQRERWKRILENPYDPVLLAELLHNPGCKFSKPTKRLIQRLLKRSTSAVLRRGPTGVAGRVEKRRERFRRTHTRERGTPKGRWVYLRDRFLWNKKHGKTQGEFLLSVEDVQWLFFEFKTWWRGKEVTLSELEGKTRMIRLDKDKPVCLSNVKVVLQTRRPMTGKKRDNHWKLKTKKVFFDPKRDLPR